MLEDALAAVETIRRRADELGVDPHRLGVMGSSAGGHLAAHALTSWGDYEADIPLRPDFGVLCYPVIAMDGPHCHLGSREKLIGPEPDPSRIAVVSPERRVTGETPPCFLWHTMGDGAVSPENSLLFAEALRSAG